MGWLACCGVVFAIATAVRAADAPAGHRPLMRFAPGDAWVCLHVPDVPRLLDAWAASPFYRFYTHDEAGPFFAPLRERLRRAEAGLASDRGIDFADGRGLLSGGLLFAIAPADDGIAWRLVFEHRADGDLARRLRRAPGLDPASRMALDHGPRTFHRYAATTGTTWFDGPRDEYIGATLVAIASAHGEPIRDVLDRLDSLDGATPTPPFAGETPSAVEASIALGALAEHWLERGGAAPLRTLGIDPEPLALDAVRVAIVAIDLQPDRLQAELALRFTDAAAGLGRLLLLNRTATDAHDAPDPARLVPPAAIAFAESALAAEDLWRELMTLLEAACPAGHAELAAALKDFERRAGVDLAADLLVPLGPRLARFTTFDPVLTRTSLVNTWIVRLGERRRFESALRRTLDFATSVTDQLTVDWRPGEGRELVRLRAGEQRYFIALTDGWLFAGRDRPTLEACIRRLHQGGTALIDRPAFARAADALPAGPLAQRGFADISACHVLLRAGGASNLVDLARLPSRRVWDRYFGPLSSWRVTSAEGLRLGAAILYPQAHAVHQ